MKELFIESIIDPKTGTQVFVRENDFEPYEINAGGLVKARKGLKKKKLQLNAMLLSQLTKIWLAVSITHNAFSKRLYL